MLDLPTFTIKNQVTYTVRPGAPAMGYSLPAGGFAETG